MRGNGHRHLHIRQRHRGFLFGQGEARLDIAHGVQILVQFLRIVRSQLAVDPFDRLLDKIEDAFLPRYSFPASCRIDTPIAKQTLK